MDNSVIKVLFVQFILISYGVGFSDKEILEEQPYRTGFHFQPPKNWMNDPNGPMYYNGVYHLFYQYNPYAAAWGNISWAHSVSYNLVTGDDFLGQQVQNLAMPKDLSDLLLRECVKSSHNPLMAPNDGIDPNFFRDPTTAWQKSDGSWRVLVGSQIEGHGAALLYSSSDFVNWERAARPLHASNRTGMWECPDFFPVSSGGDEGLDTSVNGVDVRHVLKASFNDHDYYVLGSYDSATDGFSVVGVDFMDDVMQLRYDYGVFYASKTFYDDAKKRRVLWGWVTEADSEANDIQIGWSGLQSLPRSVLLDEDKKQLIQWPIEEVEELRGVKVTLENKEIESGSVLEIGGITASQADVEVSFRVPNLESIELIDERLLDPQLLCRQKNASVNGVFGPFGLLVLASEDLTEQTAVFFRIFKRNEKHVVLMCSDQSRSSMHTPVQEAIFGSFLDVEPDQEISLRTLVDHSIVESFGGKGKSCITTRVYPKLAILATSMHSTKGRKMSRFRVSALGA